MPTQKIPGKVYFTIKPGASVGFTDQLSNFNAYYRLGMHLGFEYLHTSFCSTRSSREIYRFLGFNNHFNKQDAKFCDARAYGARTFLTRLKYRLVVIHLNDRILDDEGIHDFEGLVKYITDRTDITGAKPALVRFSGKSGRAYYWIHSRTKNSVPVAGLRSSYFSRRSEDPRQSRFEPESIKILAHIRQGDTAFLPTPWGTIIDTKRLRQLSLKELGAARHTDVDHFHDLLGQLTAELGQSKYSLVVSSDGYARAFKKIIKNREALGLSSDQIMQIKAMNHSFEREKFSVFRQYSGTSLIIGESDENLFDLVHSAMSANLIIVGDQQTMLLKLMISYADPDNPPLFLHLHNRGKINGYGGKLGLKTSGIKVESVDLDYDNSDLFKRISSALMRTAC